MLFLLFLCTFYDICHQTALFKQSVDLFINFLLPRLLERATCLSHKLHWNSSSNRRRLEVGWWAALNEPIDCAAWTRSVVISTLLIQRISEGQSTECTHRLVARHFRHDIGIVFRLSLIDGENWCIQTEGHASAYMHRRRRFQLWLFCFRCDATFMKSLQAESTLWPGRVSERRISFAAV